LPGDDKRNKKSDLKYGGGNPSFPGKKMHIKLSVEIENSPARD